METTFLLEVTGSAVNRIPAACGNSICCTTTAMWTFRWSKPFRRRYVTARSVNREAQHRLTSCRIAANPTTFRYVSCWPAKEAVGRSSAVALDRTAQAAGPPHRAAGLLVAAPRARGEAD